MRVAARALIAVPVKEIESPSADADANVLIIRQDRYRLTRSSHSRFLRGSRGGGSRQTSHTQIR